MQIPGNRAQKHRWEGIVGRFRETVSRMLGVFGRRNGDADLDEELRTHVEFAAEENRRRGMSQADARREALRQMRRSPGFAVSVIVTLALERVRSAGMRTA